MFWISYGVLLTLANKHNNSPTSSDAGKKWMLEKSMRAGQLSTDTYWVLWQPPGILNTCKYLNIPQQEVLQQNCMSEVHLALNLLASFNAPCKRQLTMNLCSLLHNIYNFMSSYFSSLHAFLTAQGRSIFLHFHCSLQFLPSFNIVLSLL